MRKLVLLILLPLMILRVSAQINKYGTPIIKNYSTQITKGSEQNWSITKDKFGAVYFANDEKGVIRYDGSNWTAISVRNNSRVRALGTDKDGIIYVGCESEFGYIEAGIKGNPEYTSLSQRFDSLKNNTEKQSQNPQVNSDKNVHKFYVGNINSLVVKDSSVYYLSDESLFIYNINNDSFEYIDLSKSGYRQCIRIFAIEDRIILADNVKGLLEVKNGKIEILPGGDFFARKISLIILPVTKGKVLVGTYMKGIFLYDYLNGTIDEKWVEKTVNDRLSRIYCGAKLSSGEYVLGTIGSGILVLSNDGKLVSLWDNGKTELPDNTIYALFADPNKNSELWISTYGYISKAYTNIPITKFGSVAAESSLSLGTRMGLSGINSLINGFCEFDSSIYISTVNGVLKGQVDKEGCRYFEKVRGIDDETFQICPAEIGNESFVLVSSSNGLYQILKKGRVRKIEVEVKSSDKKNEDFSRIRYLSQSRKKTDQFYVENEPGVLTIIEYENGKWIQKRRITKLNGLIFSGKETKNGDLLVLTGDPNKLFRVRLNDTTASGYGSEKGLPVDIKLNSLAYIEDNILLLTEKGILKFNEDSDSWIHFDDITKGYSSGKNITNIFEDPDNDVWVEILDENYHIILFSNKKNKPSPYQGSLVLLPNVMMADFNSISDRIWLAKSKNLFVLDKKKLFDNISDVQTLFSKISIGGDSVIMNGSFYKELKNGKRIPSSLFTGSRIPKIKYNLNSISFYWATPSFIEEDLTNYSYKLEGYSNNWSKWGAILYKDYTNLLPGRYSFIVKARNSQGIESSAPVKFDFIVRPPFYLTWWFILLSVVILTSVILILIRTQNLVRDKKILELKVIERTAEITQKNLELEDKNRNITASIIYAERIQRAILPRKELLDSLLKDYFIIFKPRDIVSGDFYWATKVEGTIIIAAVDCTGHGVPGAFMSILGSAFLNEIINKEYITHPGVILRRLRKEVIHSLQQRGEFGEQKDGMDISLCAIDSENMKLQYAGANNPLYLIRSSESKILDIENQLVDGNFILYEMKGSKMPISIYDAMNNFEVHEIDLLKGDILYLFTDGFADQFGGPSGKKLQYNNLKKILLSHCSEPMNDQIQLIGKELDDWKGENDQIDDDLLIGFRIVS